MLFNNGKTVTSENPDTILQQMPTVCWVLPVRCCDTVVNETVRAAQSSKAYWLPGEAAGNSVAGGK